MRLSLRVSWSSGLTRSESTNHTRKNNSLSSTYRKEPAPAHRTLNPKSCEDLSTIFVSYNNGSFINSCRQGFSNLVETVVGGGGDL